MLFRDRKQNKIRRIVLLVFLTWRTFFSFCLLVEKLGTILLHFISSSIWEYFCVGCESTFHFISSRSRGCLFNHVSFGRTISVFLYDTNFFRLISILDYKIFEYFTDHTHPYDSNVGLPLVTTHVKWNGPNDFSYEIKKMLQFSSQK